MTPTNFDEVAWIRRFGAVLEEVAANARPQYSPQPPEIRGVLPIKVARSLLHQGYRSLAARAKHDAASLRQFNKSRLWLQADPVEARAILAEHPLAKTWLLPPGGDKTVMILNRSYGPEEAWLVKCLAKLAVKEGGKETARRLHRFLTAMADGSVPADEIIVFHGLTVPERVDLGRAAYLAPYGYARTTFGLPEEPEPFPETSTPDAAVLVRSVQCGPSVQSRHDGPGLPPTQASYRFPLDYRMSLEDWFRDAKFIVALLSIAARTPVLSRTRYVLFREWIREIDPNLAHFFLDSGGYSSDAWPEGRELSRNDIDAFLAMSVDWYVQAETQQVLKLAVRRLAASFSRPGGPFGTEDRILDVAIALEIFYGGKQGHELAKRAARLLGADAAEQIETYDQVRHFYRVRSRIVHAEEPRLALDSLGDELEAGRDLASRSLTSLLKYRQPVNWSQVRPYLEAEAEAHVAQRRPNRKCIPEEATTADNRQYE